MLAGLALAVHKGPIHPPFQILVWWRDFGDMPAVTAVLAPYLAVLRTVAVGLAVVTLIAAILASGRRDRHDVHGSAHWATHRATSGTGSAGWSGSRSVPSTQPRPERFRAQGPA